MDIPIDHTAQTQHAEVNTERQQKAREYARIRRRLSFINIGISVVAVLLIITSIKLAPFARFSGNALFASWIPHTS